MTRAAVLAIDQGTTGTRAIFFSADGKACASAYQEYPQIFPKPGWVEHDALKIWQSVRSVILKAAHKTNLSCLQAIGITNQRETTVLWDRRTGKPVANAIVWQDRRTSDDCAALRKKGYEKEFREKTGLVLDPYFSGTKIAWYLNHIPGLRKKAMRGDVLFGTIDSWLLWNLTGGQVHATDVTNASRTLLFNIRTQKWDRSLLRKLNIPEKMLPKVMPSGSVFGKTSGLGFLPDGISICAIMGDQQAALYGQGCYAKGEVKNTYGTGCFAVVNLGKKMPRTLPHGLLATIACDASGMPAYALEGAIFIGGAVIQWIRDGLKLIKHAADTEKIAKRIKDSGGVTLVPAFTGLGSPYWNPHARGMISGLTRGSETGHIIFAALESIAQQSADVIETMQAAGVRIRALKVDGGATHNSFLMQLQADLLRIPVLVSEYAESTAWGTAKLAGYRAGVWTNLNRLDRGVRYRRFDPKMSPQKAREMRRRWKTEVSRLL